MEHGPMWKVILILSLIFGNSEINLVYNSPQSYATNEGCREAMDGDDKNIEAWISAKVEELLALPVLVDTKDLTYFCSEMDSDEHPI